MADHGRPPYTHDIWKRSSRLSPRDLRQIDAWVDWWFDTDTLFGRANSLLAVLGAVGGLLWAVISAVTTELTFGSVVLMPIFAFFAGCVAGAFAVPATAVWLLWNAGVWAVGLFG